MKTLLPFEYYKKFLENKLNEIKINFKDDFYIDYTIAYQESKFINNEKDYIISFSHKEELYVIALLCFPINGIKTYNIVFTTHGQWTRYNLELSKIIKRGFITKEDNISLDKIISKTTNYNETIPLMRNISWILMDIHKRYFIKDKNFKLSLIDTEDRRKINLYRNIIKDSFDNIKEMTVNTNEDIYYIYDFL